MILHELQAEYDNLNDEINLIINECDAPILQAKSAQIVISHAIENIHNKIIKKGFRNEQDEIIFFKTIFPLFLAQQFFFNCIHNFETHKPVCSDKVLKKYWNKKHTELNRFFKTHKEFYHYLRSDSSHSDNLFFTRNQFETIEDFCNLDFTIDNRFSTKHTHLIAMIISNNRLKVYIQSEVNNLKNPIKSSLKEKKSNNQNIKLTWTYPKISLIEVLYAFRDLKVFNDGNANISQIVKAFEDSFNVDLNNYSRTHIDITDRKIEVPKFINLMLNTYNEDK
jgi:hypothetical protein